MKKVIKVSVISAIISVCMTVTCMCATVQSAGVVSDKSIGQAQQTYNQLPDSVRSIIEMNGYQIFVTSANLEQMYTGQTTWGWLGCTDSNKKLIYVADNTPYVIDKIMLHECAHGINFSMEMPSQCEAWINAYQLEGRTISPYAEVTSASEWFSECYMMYYREKESFQLLYPLSYQFMSNYIVALDLMMTQ